VGYCIYLHAWMFEMLATATLLTTNFETEEMLLLLVGVIVMQMTGQGRAWRKAG